MTVEEPIIFLSVVMKPGSDCCLQTIKIPYKDIEEILGATASLADAKEISVDPDSSDIGNILSGNPGNREKSCLRRIFTVKSQKW